VVQAKPPGSELDQITSGHEQSDLDRLEQRFALIGMEAPPRSELAARMGTTQSAIAHTEGSGTRPTLDTLERLAAAIDQDLVVGLGPDLSTNRGITEFIRDGHAVIRNTT
jgi:transcriptional regulator with XRE-family HTH domain